jgi:hypothetical protein
MTLKYFPAQLNSRFFIFIYQASPEEGRYYNLFKGTVNRNSIFLMFFVTSITYPLHFSLGGIYILVNS